jgi:NADPH-dependent 2,4-dienoyl-CoA reductase/sulfur reductase-like enzyme
VSGRFRSLDEAQAVIAAGEADMVGMTRAHIADPHLVKKTIEQGPDAVRSCIGCNQLCVGNIFTGQLLQCTVNVQVGREAEFPDTAIPRAAQPKNVLIVGGGPAGMEAARVAALAGHQVQLHEATPELGGTVMQVKNIPHLSGLADIAYWLERQVYEQGVSVHTSSYLEAGDIVQMNPDVVLVATGAQPRTDGWQLGAPRLQLDNLQAPLVIAVPDLMGGWVNVEPGKTVVVVDDTGHGEALGVTEYLLSKGAVVQFVCRFAEFAPQMNFSWRGRPALRRLHATGRFTLHTHSILSAVAADGQVEISSIVGEAAKQIAADHLVFVGYNIPQDGLLAELKQAGFAGRVELIGDCASPRYLHAAIHDGYNVASNL